MKLITAAWCEIKHSRTAFGLATTAAAVAVGTTVFSLGAIHQHGNETARMLRRDRQAMEQRLEGLRQQTVAAMQHLGFAIELRPRNDVGDPYHEAYGQPLLPPELPDRIQRADLPLTAAVPVLRGRLHWREQNRSMLISGTAGFADRPERLDHPDAVPVDRGTLRAGYELHFMSGRQPGDELFVNGQRFILAACLPQDGSIADVTAWFHPDDARQLLDGKAGWSAVLLLQRPEQITQLAQTVARLEARYPELRVMTRKREATARAMAIQKVEEKQRRALEREAAAAIRLHRMLRRNGLLAALVAVSLCVIWLNGLFRANVEDRKYEIGVLRAMGFAQRKIFTLLMIRAATAGAGGGVAGFVLALVVAMLSGRAAVPISAAFPALLFGLVTAMTGGLRSMSTALQMDPALVLNHE